ncbi:hypothetical protein JK364_08850 [Streptomyces sp. 110]|uniref:Uncharacterized protein n=1 Tax=Streptomyces endocoffeicus TaxID=2898945 RepID=A0ABS1PKA6_9ACTN|nr:hypothetical protein [Streptomyces endocoffeicus]MBL1112509.1 hypothetical protein [Streptomyces endocoffeicus]
MPGFTGGAGTEEFIDALKGAVVPRDRKAKARDLLPPVLLLASGEGAPGRAHGTGRCSPARAAVVVKDPRDLYSDEIGTLFAERFGGRSPWSTPRAAGAAVSPRGSRRRTVSTTASGSRAPAAIRTSGGAARCPGTSRW